MSDDAFADARVALPGYFAILEGREKPNFMRVRSIPVEFDENLELEELWEIHDDAMKMLVEGETGEFGREDKSNLLQLKALIAERLLNPCKLCELKCGVNRRVSMGYCRVKDSRISSYFLHWGEEPELVPSFTVFFSGCNFRCVFCQNWDISQRITGSVIPPSAMAELMEKAFISGAKNVNFVGGEPTPNLPYILHILQHATAPLPVIWNSNMYMSEETMKLLDGVVDIYLGDFKWSDDGLALKYSRVPNYWKTVTRNFLLAQKHYRAELLIRHLVMPGHLENTWRVLRWIKDNLGADVRVNVMFQYYPHYRAREYPEINRRLNAEERRKVREYVKQLGFSSALVG